MKVNVEQLKNVFGSHNCAVENYIASWLAKTIGWEVRIPPCGGYFPDWDFVLAKPNSTRLSRVELKITTRSLDMLVEIGRTDGQNSGISTTRSDAHVLLNSNGLGEGKLRIVRTSDLVLAVQKNRARAFATPSEGGRPGAILVPVNIRHDLDDLLICSVGYDAAAHEFDLGNPTIHSFGVQNVERYL